MNCSGSFTYTLDLGALGEHDALVSYSGYRAARPAADDYDELDIEKISIDLKGQILDVSALIADDLLDEIKEAAWENMPTIAQAKAEADAEAFDHYWQARQDSFCEC